MKKTIFLLFISFLFHQTTTAQRRNGVLAIARYADTSVAPRLDEGDGLPEFEGGIKAFKEAFAKEFIFPQSSLDSEKGGDGVIGFTVDTLGNIYDIEIIDTVSADIDAEALYVFSKIAHFSPIWKPMKLAVLYRAYPSIYKDEQGRKLFDTLLATRKPSEWVQFVDKKRPFAVFSANMGATIPTGALNRYVRPLFQISGQLDVFKNRWGGTFAGTLRGSTIRKNFEYKDDYWDKDSSIALHSVGLFVAYRLIEEDRLNFTPFIGFSTNILILASEDYENRPKIVSFLPTIGGSIDIIRRQKAENNYDILRLNTSLIRLHFAINMANFKDGRRGNIVDLGVGLGWYTRQVFIKQ